MSDRATREKKKKSNKTATSEYSWACIKSIPEEAIFEWGLSCNFCPMINFFISCRVQYSRAKYFVFQFFLADR